MTDSPANRSRFWLVGSTILTIGVAVGPWPSSSAGSSRSAVEWCRTERGLTGRSIIDCPTGDCMILHIPPSDWRLRARDHRLDELVSMILSREGSRIVPPDGRWNVNDANDFTLKTFNCCTYAVGSLLDLGPGDWLDVRHRRDSGGIAPIQVVLDSFFEPIHRSSFKPANWHAPDSLDTVHDDDLICFVRTHGEGYRVVHVGRIRKIDGRNWMESKIGGGPVVLAKIGAVADAYSAEIDELLVFRQTVHGT